MMTDLEHGNLKSYILGFTMSVVLTITAYFVAVEDWLSGLSLIITLAVLGLMQAVVQLILFLHVGTEGKPHWKSLTFLFMIMVVLILILGSLWIMYNLNYDVMPKMGTQ